MSLVLELRNLRKDYLRGGRSFSAVKDVNLCVEQGDYVSIIGRSGSGKSTLLNMAAGMLAPADGTVVLDGIAFSGKDDDALSKIRNDLIGFIPQGALALPNLTVIENVLLPRCLYPHNGDSEKLAMELLERFGIAHLANELPNELSGGELRRALIARALINSPKLLIADEPTSDLDVESTRSIMEEFSRLNEEGMSLLIVSHDLDTLKYAHRVFTMRDGVLHEGNLFSNLV